MLDIGYVRMFWTLTIGLIIKYEVHLFCLESYFRHCFDFSISL